jgi:hypothetical protein
VAGDGGVGLLGDAPAAERVQQDGRAEQAGANSGARISPVGRGPSTGSGSVTNPRPALAARQTAAAGGVPSVSTRNAATAASSRERLASSRGYSVSMARVTGTASGSASATAMPLPSADSRSASRPLPSSTRR